MTLKSFRLRATISSADPHGVHAPLAEFLGRNAKIVRTAEGYAIEAAEIVGVDARELNRRLLSAMRRIAQGTRLRSEWTADGATERFFDYVFVKTRAQRKPGE